MARKKIPTLVRFSVKLTDWVGTPASLILHSFFFLFCFILIFVGISFDRVMLGLTTVVSLEAIYLSLLIQMTVNRQHHRIKGIEEDIDDILEDTEELTEEDTPSTP